MSLMMPTALSMAFLWYRVRCHKQGGANTKDACINWHGISSKPTKWGQFAPRPAILSVEGTDCFAAILDIGFTEMLAPDLTVNPVA